VHLKTVQLQNYRTHKDCSVTFGQDITLIQGPNESGKSTLVEAIHRALFLKAKGTSEVHKAMQSNHGGDPSVALSFEAAGKTHHLRKEFSGNKGTTKLETEGEATLNGDAAEDALAGLLQVDGAIQGRGAAGAINHRWAHLWVWQGASNASPLAAAAESQSALRNKLQEQVGEGLSASTTDNELIARIQQLNDESYTSGNKAKAGSDLKRTEDALLKAEQAVLEKQATLTALESAADTYTQSEADLQRHQTTLDEANKELISVNGQLKQVDALRQSVKDKAHYSDQAADKLKALKTADKNIRKLETDLKTSSEAAAPKKQEVDTLLNDHNEARERLNQATSTRERASQQSTLARAQLEAWQAHVELLKANKALERLQKNELKINQLNKDQKVATRVATKLEAFTTRAVKALRKKQQAAENTQARLEAHALRLEILESDTKISIGNETIPSGGSQTLTEATEIHIGKGTRLKLTPGSSSDLDSARDQAFAAEAAFKEALQSLGVTDLDAAERQSLELQTAENDLAKIQSQLDAIDPEQVADDIAAAQEAISRFEAQRDKPVEGIDPKAFTQDAETTERSVQDAEDALKATSDDEQQANSQEKALRKKAEKLGKALEQQGESYRELADSLKKIESQLDFAREQSGETEARSQQLNDAQANFDQAHTAHKTEQTKLNTLGPEDLDLDFKRLSKAIDNCDQLIQTARDQRARSQALLQSSGSTDPERDLKEAEAEHERLQQSHSRLSRQANARSLLLERLKSAQSQITAALAEPLEQAAAPYLESLFGHGSKASLQWAEDGSGLAGLSIDRSQSKDGFFTFEQLSHGTREQVGLALRLAMAEVLAADHHGQLPIVLDDAFTHADRNRIKKLQRLLYRGSERGLQIILLSCHPENYSGLTANEVAL
jgi:DNA repair exonuclease SbcCD ATPase subunit